MFKIVQWLFLICLGVLVSPKIKIVDLGGGVGADTSKNLEVIEMGRLGFSHKQIEQLLDQIEAE